MNTTHDTLEFSKRTRRTLRSMRAWAQRNYAKAHEQMVEAQARSLHSHRDDMEKATARKQYAAAEERMVRWGMYVEAVDEVLASQPSDEPPGLFDEVPNKESGDGTEQQQQTEEAGAESEAIDHEYTVTDDEAAAIAGTGSDGPEGGEQDGDAESRPVQDDGGEDATGPEDRSGAQLEHQERR